MSTLFRVKCINCGEVVDVAGNSVCKKCNALLNLPEEGMVQIYRMGSPIGIAVGYGVYINGHPCGHIGNKQSIRIPLPFGTYTFHFTCGMTRKCQDVTITLSPDAPNAYVKARIKPGFWTNTIIAEAVNPEDMPPL